MKTVSFILIAALLFACNNSSQQSKESTTDPANAVTGKIAPAIGEQCYLFVAAKDTYALKLNIVDTSVKGTAVFKNHEKDSSHGTVEGHLSGDILRLWYSFQSEGISSVRELYFKKEGDNLVTGISSEATRADTAYVPDAKAVSYTGPVYIKGDCAGIPEL